MSLSMGQIIKKLRKERNLTQEELADQLNVTFQAISKWENETGMPDISQIVPLASVFGVSTDVLFGTYGINDEEEVRNILKKIEELKMSGGVESLKCAYDLMQEGLKKYPNNLLLLGNSLEIGMALAYKESDCYYEACGEVIYRECIRQANLVISYDKNVSNVLRANMIMVLLHASYGATDKAWEYANKFPWRSDFTIHHMSAFISYFEKNYTASAEHSREDTRFHLEALAGSMMQLAYAYEHMQRNDYALEVYKRVKQLVELFPNNEHFSTPTVWKEWGQLDELITKLQS